ncbi:MAG: hypothetical protein IPI60_03670 [Saprospiraceae bacterium]|nr:hypothetical protein [Saprospiraceae bacterium]
MKGIFLLSLLSCFFLASACESEIKKTVETEVDIVGFWEGTYTTDGRPELEPQYLNLLIKSDGTLTSEGSYLSNIRINIGTWDLEGDIFKYQVTNVYGGDVPNPQVGTATFDTQGRLEGSIVNLSGTGSVRFEMVKRE